MVESVGGLRGGGLPCGGCQRFESAYLQLVNLDETKLYDSTQFFRFGSSIYDLSFMDVDKILPLGNKIGMAIGTALLAALLGKYVVG